MGMLYEKTKEMYKKLTSPEQKAAMKEDAVESVMKGVAMIPGEYLRVKAIKYMEQVRKEKGI